MKYLSKSMQNKKRSITACHFERITCQKDENRTSPVTSFVSQDGLLLMLPEPKNDWYHELTEQYINKKAHPVGCAFIERLTAFDCN